MKKNVLNMSIVLSLILIFAGCENSQVNNVQPIKINGEKRFVIGNYHNPKDLEELKILAENGFNLVRCSPTKESLDLAKKAGLYGWVNTGGSVDFSDNKNERKEKLTELVKHLKDHPALAVWEVPDEALWSLAYNKEIDLFYWDGCSKKCQDSIITALSLSVKKKSKGYAEGCAEIKNLDPIHPIWMNHAPRNSLSQLQLFSQPADIVGCDIYPLQEAQDLHSDILDKSLTAVGGYTDIMQSVAQDRPVWMVLQAFSWELLLNPVPEILDPTKFPSYKDSRAMAWSAILHGAKGIFYWGSYKVDSKSIFWKNILGVTKEIAALEPFLIKDEFTSSIKVEPIQFKFSIKTRVVSMVKKHQEDYLLVFMQEDLNQAIDVSGLDFIEGKTLYELTTDRTYIVKDGNIRIWYSKEPHVLCTSRKYDVVHESQFPAVEIDYTNFMPDIKAVNTGVSNVFFDKKEVELIANFPKSKIYYTLDGSEPDNNSMLYNAPIVITKPLVLKAKEYVNKKNTGKVFVAEFKKASLQQSTTVKNLKNGLNYQYYEYREKINSTEQLLNKTATDNGVADNFEYPNQKMPVNFGLIFNGYIKIPKTGIYTFSLNSNDGAKMYFNNQLLINNDGLHGNKLVKQQIALSKGYFPVKLYYFQAGGGKNLTLNWACPGILNQKIPASVLFHTKN